MREEQRRNLTVPHPNIGQRSETHETFRTIYNDRTADAITPAPPEEISSRSQRRKGDTKEQVSEYGWSDFEDESNYSLERDQNRHELLINNEDRFAFDGGNDKYEFVDNNGRENFSREESLTDQNRTHGKILYCHFYNRNGCNRTNCTFVHDISPPCKNYLKGKCRRKFCMFTHPRKDNTESTERERRDFHHRKEFQPGGSNQTQAYPLEAQSYATSPKKNNPNHMKKGYRETRQQGQKGQEPFNQYHQYPPQDTFSQYHQSLPVKKNKKLQQWQSTKKTTTTATTQSGTRIQQKERENRESTILMNNQRPTKRSI